MRKTASKTTAKPTCECCTFIKRIGSTDYEVSVFFSRTSRETLHDKIARLIKSEATERLAGK